MMKRYRLTGDNHTVGSYRTGDLRKLTKGDVVELTPEQYANFQDKFEPVAEAAPDKK